MSTNLQSLYNSARPPYPVELLLKVIAGNDSTSLAAWQVWISANSIERARGAEQRLLPAAGRRLLGFEIDPNDKAQLAAAKRDVWRANQLRLRGHAWVFDGLAQAGLPMMLLKGGARIAAEQGAMETRVVRDIDLLFPSSHISEAVEALIAMGLRSVNGRLPGMVKSQPFAPVRTDAQRPANYLEIDVHSVPLRLGQRGDWDDALWQRAGKAEFLGVPVFVPSPSDRFIHAIAHGLVADADSPADWAVDALFALRDEQFDPSAVCAEIQRRRLGVPIAIGSKFLRDILGSEVPGAIFDACRRDLVNPIFRREMATTMRLGEERTTDQRLLVGLSEILRSRRSSRPRRTWQTAWLVRPTFRQPSAAWALFANGKAVIAMPSGMESERGRLSVLLEGSDSDLAGRSFDLMIDGIWIGRIRVRAAGFLRQLPHRAWRANLQYRIPPKLVHAGPTNLTILALDQRKMPSNLSLSGIRAAVEVVEN